MHKKISPLWKGPVFSGIVLVVFLMTFSSMKGVFAASSQADDSIEQLTPSMSYAEYKKRYDEYYGDATAQMAEDGNPADFLVDDGKDLANKVEGTEGKSCASCHGPDATKLKGAATTFPKYDPKFKGIVTFPLQINLCREKRMEAKPLKYESYDQLALTLYVKSLSNGMPIKVSIDGPARPFFEKGKVAYYKRQGQLNFSCAICHVQYAGYRARSNLISSNEHHADHWPSYRLKWGKTGSLQRRFRGCLKNMRAKAGPFENEEFRNMELYLTYLNNGDLIEVPGMRM